MSSSAANVVPVEFNGPKKRAFTGGKEPKRKKPKIKAKAAQEGSTEEVLLTDIRNLLARQALNDPVLESSQAESGPSSLPEPFAEIDLTISEISSTGDGLARSPDSNHVYMVPFTVPGDVVKAKIIKHFPQQSYSLTDFIKVVKPSPKRDDSLIQCPYFASCSGCQLQMLSYEDQLAFKKTVVEKAYRNFSGLPADEIPIVQDTMGSPLQYGYRTKLTPHFDGPQGGRRAHRNGEKPKWDGVPPIGYMKKGQRKTLDIEDCPIGTDAVRMGLRRERERVAAQIDSYKRGATLLLRESTRRIPKDSHGGLPDVQQTNGATKDGIILEDRGSLVYEKTCVTDSNATTTEYTDDYIFTNPAGAFFQNNNSILPSFTEYIRSVILSSSPDSPSSPSAATSSVKCSPNLETLGEGKITNLIDAYSGSGLFSITLSPLFKHTLGIDISPSSIASATHNARLNQLPSSQTSFVAADASHLFSPNVIPPYFTPATTAVILDPPRKGCDEGFLRQLQDFGPERVVYVSCNVHTQARDLGILSRGIGGAGENADVKAPQNVDDEACQTKRKRTKYTIESIRGFDFFPQTGHVESVAVLRRRRDGAVDKTAGQ